MLSQLLVHIRLHKQNANTHSMLRQQSPMTRIINCFFFLLLSLPYLAELVLLNNLGQVTGSGYPFHKIKLILLSHTSKSRTLSFALCQGQQALNSRSKTLCRLSAPLAPFLDWGNTDTHPWKTVFYIYKYLYMCVYIYTHYTSTYGTNC